MTTTFTVERTDLRRTRWAGSAAASLSDDQVRLRIERFALTSNNITYGAFGNAMNYWNFFPTGDATTGCIPVWGFATVLESRAAGIAAGERFYGYFPMADQVVLGPVRAIDGGFVDAAAHRRELHGVYNHYLRCSTDPVYQAEQEDLIALLRPLFTTSFLIDDFLADNAFFGARSVLVSSASSKTAYGLGACFALRRGAAGGVSSVGLTSEINVDFTRRLGCYDRVVSYGDVTTLDASEATVYVDMSGNAGVRASIHERWAERLRYSCSVGGTHWERLGGGNGLAGPRPVLFFAPAQAKKRASEWGADVLQQRVASAWSMFVQQVSAGPQPWLRVVAGTGQKAVEDTYIALLEGRVSADEGRVLSIPS
ncbi:MAG: DUF2855 family protein [Hyphomicrobium sp.]|nr:DUF2855 family protein [Hyphomicrobium sp.]